MPAGFRLPGRTAINAAEPGGIERPAHATGVVRSAKLVAGMPQLMPRTVTSLAIATRAGAGRVRETGASMVEQNDSLLREVDEEVRREQLAKLWEKYGVLVIAAAALIVFGIGGWKFYQHQKLAAAQALGARFAAAQALVQDGKADDAMKAFEAIGKDAPSGYQTLAQLRVAGGLAKADKRTEAVAAYDALAKSPGVDAVFSDLAALQAALLRSGTADWTEMQNRLNDLVQEKSAWRHSARELLAIEALRNGRHEEARKALNQLLTDRKTPEGMAKRVQELLAIVTARELAAAAPAAARSTEGTTPAPEKTK